MSTEPVGKNSFRWKSTAGLAMLAAIAVVAFYLIAEHAGHLWDALPLVLLALCVAMHLFGHRHGGHGGGHGQ